MSTFEEKPTAAETAFSLVRVVGWGSLAVSFVALGAAASTWPEGAPLWSLGAMALVAVQAADALENQVGGGKIGDEKVGINVEGLFQHLCADEDGSLARP